MGSLFLFVLPLSDMTLLMKNKDMTKIGFSNYVFSVLKHQQEPSKQDQQSGKVLKTLWSLARTAQESNPEAVLTMRQLKTMAHKQKSMQHSANHPDTNMVPGQMRLRETADS